MVVVAQPAPSHAVVVLWVWHQRVDVIGLLNGEFDNQARSVDAVIEEAAHVACRAAPGKVQLIETCALNGINVPLGRVKVCVAHVFIDQREQQFFLCCIEVPGRQSLKSAQAVAPPDAGEHVREKGFGGNDSDPGLLRMERVHEIKTAHGFVTEDHKTGIRPGQILQGLGAEEKGRRSDPAVGTGEGRAEVMACEQPGPGFAAHRLAADRNPIVCRSHALDRAASGPGSWRIMSQIFQLLRPQNIVVAHQCCDLMVALAACRWAEPIWQSTPAFDANGAAGYSNPGTNSDWWVAPP